MAEGKLRALFVSHTYVVGVNQRKLHALSATGDVDVALLAPARWKSGDWRRRFHLERPHPEIRMYPARVGFDGWPGAFYYDPGVLRRAIAEFRPHVVQVENEVASLAAFETALLLRATRTPLAVFVWENLDRPLSPPRRWARTFVLRAARLVVAGNSEAAALVRRWGYDGPVEIMPQMGVEDAHAAPRTATSNGRLTIGFVGRLTREKGVDLLLGAADLLRQRGLDFEVLICGAGVHEAALREQASPLRDRVTWTGAVLPREVPEVMRRIDVLVLPSRTGAKWKEQFGHVLIDAMSLGIPVVGSSSGAIPEVIGRPDLIFEEGNAARLAGILERMIKDAAWRADAARYAIDRVRDQYTDERVAQRLLEAWRRAI